MGLYLIDKPIGISSNKALSEFKKKYNVSKAGFSGVLDPFASGLLIIATEMDTRLLDIFLHKQKTYTGKILFGRATNTYDTEGITTEEKEVNLTLEQIEDSIKNNFLGDIIQVPPIFSNIKVNGERAREAASKGKEITLEAKPRHIYSFEITEYKNNEASFIVEVSSGTYIRSLAYDLGKSMDAPAMLTELRRTKIGIIEVANKEIDAYEASGFEIIKIDSNLMQDLLNGKTINLSIELNELLVKDEQYVLWIKGNDHQYKIHKRLK